MFSRAAVRAARPVALASRSSARQSLAATRPFSKSSPASSGHGDSPQLYGPGSKAGEIPSLYEQATGLERLQMLGNMEGIDVFDDTPLDSSRTGTKKDPIIVPSFDHERIIGCTGSPADSHDVLWFPLRQDKQARCLECGSVYSMDFRGSSDHGHDGHH